MHSSTHALLSSLVAALISQAVPAMAQVGAGRTVSAPNGTHTEASRPSASRRFFPGELAYNRRPPGSVPTPPDRLVLHRSCTPKLLLDWAPLHWPKYDPFRDVLFLSKGLQAGYQLYTLGSHGDLSEYAPPGYQHGAIAPTGDGRVYFIGSNILSYVDANEVPHLVVDANGATFVPPGVATDMVYDPPSNSLIVLSDETSGPCTPPLHANAVLTKIPLDATGGVVIGPTSNYTFCDGLNDTSVSRIARHADGRLLLRVATSGSSSADVVWLDTLSWTTHWFCTQQLTPGESLSNELAYSAIHGGVVTTSASPCFFCPPTNRLRLFREGSTGVGQTLCTWVEDSRASYFEIAP